MSENYSIKPLQSNYSINNKTMKIALILCLAALATTGSASAQSNPFAKTTWKIDTIQADGSAILKKVKRLNLSAEQARFQYIQFDNDSKYDSGNTCFSMSGTYTVSDGHQVEFTGLDAAKASDCTEPENLAGTYSYEISKDQVTLHPVTASDRASNEEAYPATDTIEAREPEKN
jgi:hypothetical protein